MSTYQYEQFIPKLHDNGRRISGDTVEISSTVLDSFSPPPPSVCKDLLQHLLCYYAAPPCDPVSDLQLPICNDSCRAYDLLLASDMCLTFNNSLQDFIESSTVFEVQVVYELYANFSCANTSTYNFREGEGAELASRSGVCTSLFTPSLQGEQYLYPAKHVDIEQVKLLCINCPLQN